MNVKVSSTFVRGQVWLWQDPIYGKKDENRRVPEGEGGIRYNRYVVVAQTTETINSCVLVVPCSSNTNDELVVSLSDVFNGRSSYARIQQVHVVQSRTLSRYVCTLSEYIMKQIEAGIIKTLTPSICSYFPDELKRIGIDITGVTTGSNGVGEEDEPPIPIEIKEEAPKVDVKEVITKMPKIRKNWTEENIIKFLKHFQDYGSDAASNEFGLSMSTAKSYYFKWYLPYKDMLNSEIAKSPDSVEEETIEIKEEIVEPATETKPAVMYDADRFKYYVPNTKDIPNAISKISNMIKAQMTKACLYESCINYSKYKKSRLKNDDFYDAVGTSVYFTLAEFLGLEQIGGTREFIIPAIYQSTPYIGTWYFFDMIYHDRRISRIQDGAELMKAFRELYSNRSMGIDRNWLVQLDYRLNKRLDLFQMGIDVICEHIGDIFCEPK
jgi:mRNA-degrading endonuclease toxin of MazEF toxin-antitoxin module